MKMVLVGLFHTKEILNNVRKRTEKKTKKIIEFIFRDTLILKTCEYELIKIYNICKSLLHPQKIGVWTVVPCTL